LRFTAAKVPLEPPPMMATSLERMALEAKELGSIVAAPPAQDTKDSRDSNGTGRDSLDTILTLCLKRSDDAYEPEQIHLVGRKALFI